MSKRDASAQEEAGIFEGAEPTLRLPPPPLAVPIPTPAPRRTGRTLTALLWGDTHFPHHDQAALNVVMAVSEIVQPDLLVHMGDLVDAADLSEKFKKNPKRRETLQDEIDGARQHLAQMRRLNPDARFVLLEGNHEERMTRVLWNMEGPARALAYLTHVQKALTWPMLLGLDELHIEFYPYKEQSKQRIIPGYVLKHGDTVRSGAAYTAAAEWRKYGLSGASGHTHRLGLYARTDAHGSHVWIETGTTALLTPDYMPDPDWQQGCVVLTIDLASGTRSVEPVAIHNGCAMFRGELLDGRTRRPKK